MGAHGTRGILNPNAGLNQFNLERELPPEDLAPFVERFWRVSWNVEGVYAQEILPYPCVNLSLGSEGFEVHGPGTRRFVAQLAGRGRVFGVKFRPAGFASFARLPMRQLVDAVVGVEAATGKPPPAVRSDDDPAAVRRAVELFLRELSPRANDDAVLVDRLVSVAQEDRNIRSADDLAVIAGMSVRSLHRLFARYVGVGPKWIVKRSRVQEAADRVARAEHVDWARTAQELGYHDQAHFIRDFRAQVGFTPAAYARRCAGQGS